MTPWDNTRNFKINLIYSYSNAGATVRFDYSTSGTMPSVGMAVVGISIQITEKPSECDCYEYTPCINGTIQIRTSVDIPFIFNNRDYTIPVRFKVCGDGEVATGF